MNLKPHFAICISAALLAAPVRADEPATECVETRLIYETAKKAGTLPQPTAIEHEGVRGMWFADPIARYQLCQVQSLKLIKRKNFLAGHELSLWMHETRIEGRRAEIAVEAEERLKSIVAGAERRAQAAEEEMNAWDRSPVLWAVVGAAVAGIVFYGSVAAVDSLRE